MTDKTLPVCPKCGCPARMVVVKKARCRCLLNNDGTPGEVVSVSHDAGSIVSYECGGGHTFEAQGGKSEG